MLTLELSSVYAQDATSASFKIRAPVFSEFGGNATSTNFEQYNAGAEVIIGESASTNFILRAGFLYFDSFTPKSQNWRWYDDEENETPTIPLADENIAPTDIENGGIIKLRLTIKDTASIGAKNTKFTLQFSTFSDFSQQVSGVSEIGDCSGASRWCYADGGGNDNATITTKVLSDSDACAGEVGNGCGTHNESGTSISDFLHGLDRAVEYEFTIQQSGAAGNTTYFFRVVNAATGDAVPLNDGKTSPSLSTGGTELIFTVSGLESGTSTEGVVTDIETTETSIAFGSLPLGSELEGAQRFSVTTNAGNGYQIYVIEDQEFLGPSGEVISPVSGTNDSPASWASGCSGSAAGCWGYHAGDDALLGGSTRFAPNDTYARFASSTKEIVFNSVPVTDEKTDLVFKIKVTNQQGAGQYETGIEYIIVPTF